MLPKIEQRSEIATTTLTLRVGRLIADEATQKEMRGPGDRQGKGNRPDPGYHADQRTHDQPFSQITFIFQPNDPWTNLLQACSYRLPEV